ncbi:hypothetical protein [Bradyrhizobium sp. ARR65]|uniref:hypothetical protein n=1 Tax=Bradyrhizobium sp. ARR65 TaxID=1040989 RepID=UPI0004631D19|nr:hypothetical protein [Bradyrhizobium sp. ARR65]
MAKETDKKAGAFELENTGLLSGLFAEENEFDRRALLRIGTWGVTAVGAVVLAVVSNQSSLGWRREQVAAADLARQAQQIQALARESQNETRRLVSAIETLNSDRDRLFARVTVLEQGLDSVTGALAKQSPAPAPHPSAAPPVSAQSAVAQPTGQIVATAVPAPVTTTTAAPPAADKSHADASKPETQAPASAAANANASAGPLNPAAAASLMAKSMIGPPEPAAAKPAEPAKAGEIKAADAKITDTKTADTKTAEIKTAEAKAADTKIADAKTHDIKTADAKAPDVKTADAKGTNAPATASAAPPAASQRPSPELTALASAKNSEAPEQATVTVDVQRTDFAVDLGSANSLGGLRALWRGVRHSNAALSTLSPIIMVKEGNNGLGMQLHLAAGPLKDAATAAKICAALAERKHGCETTVYDGQRLAMTGDENQPLSVAAKPLPEAKQGSYKRSKHAKKEEPPPPAAPPPPPPPQPEQPSAFSTLFGRH